MRFNSALVLAVAGLAVAQPRKQHHRHVHRRRDPTPATEIVHVPGPTVVVYELNGQLISESDVTNGIANGTLIWSGDGLSSAPAAARTSSMTTSTVQSAAVFKADAVVQAAQTSTTAAESSPASTASKQPVQTSSTSASSSSSTSSSSSSSSSSTSSHSTSGGSGVDSDFPDGQIDCSHFPSDLGALDVPWLGLGGWTGIQKPGDSNAAGYSDILTLTSNLCQDGNCCVDGAFCSYACPEGYHKTQWPDKQGSTGQSIGGIQCRNGKLHLTRPGESKLCSRGTDRVHVKVRNQLGQSAAVCRTDYPGTESETVPLNALPGQTHDLTCPDADSYFVWQGMPTSAQYYLNPAGVDVATACQWGTAGNDWGNFAPVNFGVGYRNGLAWLSIFQNAPTTDVRLNYTVELVGDNMNGRCKYQNGQYCNDAGCNSQGCTVSVSSGEAHYVLSQ